MALMVWWLFFSRARRAERLGGVGLIALAPGGTWLLKHDSMWLPWLFAYALPLLCPPSLPGPWSQAACLIECDAQQWSRLFSLLAAPGCSCGRMG
ncbi:MAG TPA: hypothetical protein VFY67_11535 [Pyrinomonadaceae bacterium]|nr:hypothetical protein [Pyrinomonadaceae bacterium]